MNNSIATSEVTDDGEYQIVNLPEGFQFVGDQVGIQKIGNSVVLTPLKSISTNAMQINFNFYAMKWLIQWETIEKPLYMSFKNDVSRTRAQVVERWLSHFRVARNLRGIGALKASGRDIYSEIVAMLDLYGHGGNLVENVLEVEGRLQELFGIKDSMLSVASKLSWLCNRINPIFDNYAANNLCYKKRDYAEFVQLWKTKYSLHKQDIQIAANQLVKLKDFAPSTAAPLGWDLTKDPRRDWFHERIFDMYLWRKS